MQRIPLRRRDGAIRAYALVDDEDAARVACYRWCLQLGARGGYASRTDRSGDRQRTILLHREILGLSPGGLEVDHVNGDKLDCRRSNMRLVTHAQNGQNRRKVHGRSRYRGVTWYERYGKWLVRVGVGYRRRFGGYYDDEDEAGARAAALRAELLTHAAECA